MQYFQLDLGDVQAIIDEMWERQLKAGQLLAKIEETAIGHNAELSVTAPEAELLLRKVLADLEIRFTESQEQTI